MSSIGAHFDIESISLDGGWSGKVLTRFALPDCLGRPPSETGSVDQWRGPLRAIAAGGGDLPDRAVFKASRTAEVYRARIEVGARPIDVVCKRNVSEGFVRSVVQRWRRSREMKSWERAFVLLRAGIRTALPLAILERVSPKPSAWLICEAIPKAVDLDRVLSGLLDELDAPKAVQVKRALIGELVDLCCRMMRNGIGHRDFKASNILVTDWNRVAADPKLWLVDLDGIHPSAEGEPHSAWPAITRLGASLAACRRVTRTDRMRFLHAFLHASGGPIGESKRRWRDLARSMSQYNRRSQRRKRGKLDGYLAE